MKVRNIRRQERPPTQAQLVCWQAYQVVGSLLSDLGKFHTPEAGKILDNLSQARLVHRDVLPWDSYEPNATQDSDIHGERECSFHPAAPHGFDRNASHNAGRYVCECENWSPPPLPGTDMKGQE